MADSNWASEALVRVLTETLVEQKRVRRWKTLGRALSLVVIIVLGLILLSSGPKDLSVGDINKPHAALIEISGLIDSESFYGSADHVIESLREAYKKSNVKGIILDLNSPGGSPVQSDLIYEEIRRLQATDKSGRKVYAVVSDVCASGCYYIASAAHQIYANELSTVGSIGVLASGFGFVDLIKKVGVERRLHTSGKFKAFLDPFSNETAEGKKILQEHLNIIHNIFINKVKAGRGNRIKNDPNIYSGLFWTGKQSLELGLIDGFMSKNNVASKLIKTDNIVSYTVKPSMGDILSGGLTRFSSQAKLNELFASFKLN